MKRNNSPVVKLAFIVFGAFIVVAVANGQDVYSQDASSSLENAALVTDWSHHHLIYSAPNSNRVPVQFEQEPRYLQQLLRRNPELSTDPSGLPVKVTTHFVPQLKRFKRDWAMSLGPGATVGAGQYPAKYSFSITTANCDSATHPDFVAFNPASPDRPRKPASWHLTISMSAAAPELCR